MRDTAAGLEAHGIPWPEHGLALVLPQDQFAFEHVDELVLLFVPMAQRRGRARFDARDIDAELGQGHRIADPLLFASRDHRGEFFRIRRDLLRWNFFDLDLGHLLPHITAANDRNPSIYSWFSGGGAVDPIDYRCRTPPSTGAPRNQCGPDISSLQF